MALFARRPGHCWLRLSLSVAVVALASSSPPPAAAPRRLRVLAVTLPTSTDPYRDARIGSQAALLSVFEPLLRDDGEGHPTPVLASSWTSPGPETTCFRLRSGVRWHDGRPLLAADVAASLERARRLPIYAARLAGIVSLRADGPSTLLVRTRVGARGLEYTLGGVPIARESADRGYLGTGPYRLVSVAADQVEVELWPGYRGPPGLFSEVSFERLGQSPAAIDAAALPTVVLSPSRGLVRALAADPRFSVSVFPTASVYYLALDTRPGRVPAVDLPANPLHDVRVRRAIQNALDLNRLIAEGTVAGGKVATQMLPPGVLGFDRTLQPAAHDPAQARALLVAAGYGRGFEITLDVGPAYRELAQAVREQLAAVGIRVQLNRLDSEALRQRVDRGGSVHLYNWTQGHGSGTTLASFLHTPDVERGLGLRNTGGYSNPRVDRLLEQAIAADSIPERAALLAQVTRLLREDIPLIPLYSSNAVWLTPHGLEFPKRPDGLFLLAGAVWSAPHSPS